ncbi:mechanosensitive ion channel family protein [Desulfosarcina sp.]|uniref:mechanosensitive ion channel family protein n=1 Tax=Desulfosarcina sp. TaxID=2027861 RepID=UPI0029BA13B7|nr:mechanosensitive ion channel domain-containing protein [Desulfosarcina sp.]MDX2452596.1 mechanosensitive ion channel [Desulfosarcina sp.]MDX2494361.1 mechanosensitive ion channel [Desulfuromusa sp.]
MNQYLDPQFYVSWLSSSWQNFIQLASNTSTLLEIATIIIALLLAYIVARPSIRRLNRLLDSREWRDRFPGRFIRALLPLVTIILAVLLLRIGIEAFEKYDVPTFLIGTTARLLTAWFIIRFTTGMIRDSNWARLLSITAWFVAALHILKLLVPAIELLDKLAIDLGGVRISLLLLIKGVIVFSVLLKLASTAASMMEKRISTIKELTPSVQVLLTKALTITLMTVAVVVAFSSLGINLSAFAFIGGAIGVGIGFGLQKVVSNLISGVILLLDKSIKPGDVVGVGNSYGKIQSLGARYVSVVTRDGYEYLIPNEDLITQQVINWSFSDRLVRLKIGVGVSYDTDLHKAMDLIVQSARGIDRVLDKPGPVCQLNNFGDSAVDLELRIWIGDPDNGVANVSSAVRIAIWDAFKEHGIEIPFPQRDVHIKSQSN